MWHIKQAFVGWLKSLFRSDAIETEHIVFTDPGNYAHKMCSAVTFMRLNSALLRCCLGAFKDQTWKQSCNPHAEPHLLRWAVSGCRASEGGGVQEAPLPLAAQGRWLVLCLAAWLGASKGSGLCLSSIQGRGCCGGERMKLWLPEQGTLMCKAAAKIAALCLSWCFRHSALWLRTASERLPAWQGSALQPPRLLLSCLCVFLGGWWLTWPTWQEREEKRNQTFI